MDKLQHHVSCPCLECISHPTQARSGLHVFPDRLYVVSVLENPLRWRSRYENYWHFQKAAEDAGAILITVESVMGDRHFEVTEPGNPFHVQVRAQDELFRKENLQNLGLARLPLGASYVALIDADVVFVRPDWCQETLHLLQHYDLIQMFTEFSDLGPDHRIMGSSRSFMWNFTHGLELFADFYYYSGGAGRTTKWSGAPGLAWAYRVSAVDALGGMLDRCIVGGGDSHMAFGVVAKEDAAKLHLEYLNGSDAYRRYTTNWQANAARLQMNVGYMEGTALHKFHGPKRQRGYATRWKILKDNDYDPAVDIIQDHHGLIRLRGNKVGLRDDIRTYFRQRNEDANTAQ